MMTQVSFLLGIAFAASPWASPPSALAAGICLGLLATPPFSKKSKEASKFLLQASVVCLGFGMNLHQVIKAGSSGFLWTAGGICFSMALGTAIGRALRVREVVGYLISVGTAICGGSAIAAIGPVLGATEEEMSVSLGTVFLLNSIALLTFPSIGRALGLSEGEFGLWAALAIHDTSSVVGATAKYGASALAIGTTVKLARALWIVPVSLATAVLKRSQARVRWPWFILFFLLAAGANTALPMGAGVSGFLYKAGRVGLTVTLFLIGSGISKTTLASVGPRPLLQGILLWLAVAVCSLALIQAGVFGSV